MKIRSNIVFFVTTLVFLIGFTSCATKGIKQAGFLEDYSKLEKDSLGFADWAYRKDNVVWGAYDKVIIEQVTFFLKDDAQYKGIDADEFDQLAQHWNDSMVASMSKSYQIVSEPGPNTLRLSLAITNLVPSKPVVGTVTTLVPVGLAASNLKRVATGSHIGIGEAGFEADIRDSITGEVLAAAVSQAAGKKYKIARTAKKWGQIKDIFDIWTDNLGNRLDKLSGR